MHGVESQASQRTKSEQSVWQETHAMNSGVCCAQDSTSKGVCPISFCKSFWCMFSILCFPNYWTFFFCWLYSSLNTWYMKKVFFLKFLIDEASRFFNFFPLFWAMWSAKVLFFSFFMELAKVAIIHMRNSSNLATGHRGKFKNLTIFWQICWNLVSKYGNFRSFFPPNLTSFLTKKPLCEWITLDFVSAPKWQNFDKEGNAGRVWLRRERVREEMYMYIYYFAISHFWYCCR